MFVVMSLACSGCAWPIEYVPPLQLPLHTSPRGITTTYLSTLSRNLISGLFMCLFAGISQLFCIRETARTPPRGAFSIAFTKSGATGVGGGGGLGGRASRPNRTAVPLSERTIPPNDMPHDYASRRRFPQCHTTMLLAGELLSTC